MTTKIAILGDFNPKYSTHHRLNDSIRQIRGLIGREIQFDWISTDIFESTTAFHNAYSGLWIAPGSPYTDMENVLKSIKYARENKIPAFGNCGGFQHIVVEYARNVCGIKSADHEETNPIGEDLVITKLLCSLVEQQEELEIIDTESILFKVIHTNKLIGKYFCSYGINTKYLDILKAHGVSFTAQSKDGQIRAIEIKLHPFYVGTLFQPALTSTVEEPDPVILEFIKRCIENDK
jgi:CTP synthase (UTP-ammonia lyase)